MGQPALSPGNLYRIAKQLRQSRYIERSQQLFRGLGEDVAARYLVSRGYEIIARNWTCQAGEADIIARDDDILVFAEVKTRSSTEKGFPSEAVDSKKRGKYLKIAELFTSRYDAEDLQVRFDVMSLVVTDNAHATIRHYINAFGAESL